MKHFIEIVEYKTGKVVETKGPYDNKTKAEKIDRGFNINLDTDRYYTRLVEKK